MFKKKFKKTLITETISNNRQKKSIFRVSLYIKKSPVFQFFSQHQFYRCMNRMKLYMPKITLLITRRVLKHRFNRTVSHILSAALNGIYIFQIIHCSKYRFLIGLFYWTISNFAMHYHFGEISSWIRNSDWIFFWF